MWRTELGWVTFTCLYSQGCQVVQEGDEQHRRFEAGRKVERGGGDYDPAGISTSIIEKDYRDSPRLGGQHGWGEMQQPHNFNHAYLVVAHWQSQSQQPGARLSLIMCCLLCHVVALAS